MLCVNVHLLLSHIHVLTRQCLSCSSLSMSRYIIIFHAVCVWPVQMISLLALVILKLADNGGTALVGVHVVPTFLFALNTGCFISMGLNQFLRALKGTMAGAVHLPSTAGGGGGGRRSQQKTLHQLYAIFLGVLVPCMFQDVPLLVSLAYPPEIPVDGAPLDAKRAAAAVWIGVQMVCVVAGGALSWYTAIAVANFFKPILQFSTSMNESTRLRITALRDTSVEAHRGFVRISCIMLLVGLVVRVPTPWWTATQSYWLPMSKCLQAINIYNASRVYTTKRVSSMITLSSQKASRRIGATTTGSTRPDTTELVSIVPKKTAEETDSIHVTK